MEKGYKIIGTKFYEPITIHNINGNQVYYSIADGSFHFGDIKEIVKEKPINATKYFYGLYYI